MGKLVVPTGYMGSGSSAITDLISEMEGYDAEKGTFEYVFLHCPNGVFDLEDKLLIGNNAIRSDEALHSFGKTMKQLYDKKYWWVGHYNENLSPRFMEYTDEYIDTLVQCRPSFYWYYQENANMRMIVKLIWKRIVALCTLGKIQMKKPLEYDDMMLSYVNATEFYEKTKVYLRKLWKELGIEKRNVILDQLLLPFNLYRLENYFDDNEITVFVIDRDPRDIFITNKYIWSQRNEPVPYPTEVMEFCKCYKALREMERKVSLTNVHRIHFEDLIYNYEVTVDKVLSALGEDAKKHIEKGQRFNPQKSIENTQIYLSNEEFMKETGIIEKELSEYLYEFPYERKPDSSKTF